MQPKIKKWLTIATASVLSVGVIASSAMAINGSLPNLFAETADSGGPLKADPVTLGSWSDIEPGEVWTDKSIFTDTLTLSDNEEEIKITPDENTFGVALSVLSSGERSAVNGDVTFTERLGKFMDVKSIDGLFYRDGYHTVDEFIAYFERASGADRTKIENLVSSRIRGVDGATLINKAIDEGSFVHDANWIDWYENAQGDYVEKEVNAVAQNRSFFFYGIQGVEAMNIEVRVRTDLTTHEQVLTFTVPESFVPRLAENKMDSPLRLFYQVGVSETYDFSNVPAEYKYQDTGSVDAFTFGDTCTAKFTPAGTNEYYQHLTRQEVAKSQNVTDTYEYNQLIDKLDGNNDVTVFFGNNGRVIVTKPGSVEVSVGFVPNDAEFYGSLDRFTYRLQFEGDHSDSYAVSTSQGFISLNEFGQCDVNIFKDQPMVIYNVEPGVKITATARTEHKDYKAVNTTANCSVHAGQRDTLAFLYEYIGEIPEEEIPLPTLPPETPVEKPLDTPPEYYDLTIRNEVIGDEPEAPFDEFEYTVLLQGDLSGFSISDIKLPEGCGEPTEVRGTNSKQYKFKLHAGEQVVFDDIIAGATYTVTQDTNHSDYVTAYTSNRNGKLNSDQMVTVTNTSVNAASHTIEVINNLTGSVPFDSITFKYEMQSTSKLANGTYSETKYITYNKQNGKLTVAFDPITYTEAGQYVYNIYQSITDRRGSTWDKSVYMVYVTVEKQGNQLVVTDVIKKDVNENGENIEDVVVDSVTYNNKYEPQTVTVPGFDIIMRLKGDDSVYTGDFRFVLDNDRGYSPYQGEHKELTISYDAAKYDPKVLYKSAKFDDITFDKPGKYLYVITLYDGQVLPGSNRNMNYNAVAYRVNVTVTADATGKLSASQNLEVWHYKGDFYKDTADRIMYFEAEYTKPEFGEVTHDFKIQSAVEGDTRDGKTALRYRLSKVENRTTDSGMIIREDYPMPLNDVVVAEHEGTGTVKLNFGEALYSVPGTSVYNVKQEIGNIAGMTYDKSEYEIKVKAVNSEGTNRMSIESVIITRVVDADGNKLNGTHAGNKPERVGSIKFVNTYHPLNGAANVPVNVAVEGDNYSGMFDFEIVAEDDKYPMPAENIESVGLGSNQMYDGRWVGYGQFDTIQYTELGDYKYIVRQKDTLVPGMIYDKSEFRATVTMVDTNGWLSPTFKYERIKNADGSDAAGNVESKIQFNNRYNALTNVSVDVVWISDDGFDRPTYVDVQRYADKGVFGDPVRLSSQNAWHYEWTDSDADPDWTVDVPNVPEGFEKTVKREGNHFIITLDDIFPEGEENRISVLVKFENDHERTDKPENLQLLLRENGIIFGRAMDVNEEHDWRWSWHNLNPANEYTVEVLDEVKGWDVDIVNDGHNNVTITFKSQPITPDPIDLKVVGSWNIENSREPDDEIAVQLYRDGEAYGNLMYLSEFNDWTHVWPKLDGAYEWSVDEPQVPEGFWRFVQHKGNDWEIINNDFPIPDEGASVSVVKVWENVAQWRHEPVSTPSSGDKETDEKYGLGIYGELGDTILDERPAEVPAEVLVQLKIGGANVGDAVSLNDDNGWQYTWKGLDDKYKYTVEEVTELEQYETKYAQNGDNWTITNSYVDSWYKQLNIKILWNVSDAAVIPDSVKVQIYADGQPYGQPVEVKKSDNWTYTADKLSRFVDWTAKQMTVSGMSFETKQEDGTWIFTNSLSNGDDSSSKPDDTDNDRPGWNNPDGDDNVNSGNDDGTSSHPNGSGWGQGGNVDSDNNGSSGSDDNFSSSGNGSSNNNQGTTIPNGNGGNGSSTTVGSGVGVGVGVGTGNNSIGNNSGNGSTVNGSGSGSSNNGSSTSDKVQQAAADNAALANSNKYANPSTGVENNMTWLWISLGVLAVVAAGVGLYVYKNKEKLFKM